MPTVFKTKIDVEIVSDDLPEEVLEDICTWALNDMVLYLGRTGKICITSEWVHKRFLFDLDDIVNARLSEIEEISLDPARWEEACEELRKHQLRFEYQTMKIKQLKETFRKKGGR